MSYLGFVFKNLTRNKLRLLLTVLVVAISFLLYGLLAATHQGIFGGIDIAGADRLSTVSWTSGGRAMPFHYTREISSVPGVTSIAYATHLGAYFQEPRNAFRVAGVNHAEFLKTYPEIIVPAHELESLLSNRSGALVGKSLAARMGWKVGDRIPVRALTEVKTDGGDTWEVVIEAIYDTAQGGINTSAMAVHYDFLNEARIINRDTVNYVISRVADPNHAEEIARAIDLRFDSAAPMTRTTLETSEARDELRQIGDVGMLMVQISIAVFLSMLLVSASVMIQIVRERKIELAVMKAIGFPRRSVVGLVLAESSVVTGMGAAFGLLLAYLIVEAVRPEVSVYLEAFRLPASSLLGGVGLSFILGVCAAAIPTFYAAQLKVVDGLRGE